MQPGEVMTGRARGGAKARVSGWLSSLGTVFLMAGMAFYFLAAVKWLFDRSWPDWSLRRMGIRSLGPLDGLLPAWILEPLLEASPGLIALITAGLLGTVAVLLDPHAVRRGPFKR